MLSVILNEIRAFARSGSNLFFTIFFPCACVFFLGTFLESVEASDEAVGELKLAYCAEGGDAYAAAALEEFVASMEKEGVLTAEKLGAEEIGGFDRTEFSAAVELDGAEILIHSGSDKIKNRTVKAIFDSYSWTAAAYMSVAAANPGALAGMMNAGSGAEAVDGAGAGSGADTVDGAGAGSGADTVDGAEAVNSGELVIHKDLGTNRSMMDYYAVTMVVMILFMGSVIGGAGAYESEHVNFTISRLDASPVGRTAVFFGKIIGSMPMVLLQVLAVMLVSTLLFGAHYCNTVSGNLLLAAMFLSASLAALSVGVLLNLIFPRIPAGLVIMPVLWLAMFFSGTFAMDIHVPGLTECMPMYVIQRAAFDLTVFGKTERALQVTAVALIIFAAMLVLGWLKANVEIRRMSRASAG